MATWWAPKDIDFPAIPRRPLPRNRTGGTRVANPWLKGNAETGVALPMLIPQVDGDGNETSGIRHPEVAVPLATYTGWNFTNADQGDPDTLVALAGSYVPFATTRRQREATNDPRPSIEERYATRQDFLAQVESAGRELINPALLAGRGSALHSRTGRRALGSAHGRQLASGNPAKPPFQSRRPSSSAQRICSARARSVRSPARLSAETAVGGRTREALRFLGTRARSVGS